ncbi:uncharacterized protein LOC133529152 [Cydia pomonella]|uniref:uncharacterized protein LOC133529152 n=1 Tax=Cydia pomonella TaxID=82600 RepID=UPI002ADE1298|nr:uncharacterized protein LOC133529152 [Cydia pomonella]
MKLLIIFFAAAYAAPSQPGHGESLGHAPSHHGQVEYINYEPIGYEQPNYDRYSYGYGNPDYVGYGGLIEQPVPYDIGRQGIGFDKRTAFAYGFRMPLAYDILKILRRYPDKEVNSVKV